MDRKLDAPRLMIGLLSGRPLRRSAALVNPRAVRVGYPEKSRLAANWASSHPTSYPQLSWPGSTGRAALVRAVARTINAGMKEKIRIVYVWVGRNVGS